MPGPKLVTTPDQLAQLTARLGRASRLACDTEAASFHRYRDRVFLLQFSSDKETAIVDPLAFDDLSALAPLFESPDTEIVFHDADFDVRSLHRDYGWEIRNVFDTRIAAQLLGEPAIGLGALLEKYFGIKVDKRFQRADWSKRPLEKEMLDYAAGDTANLLALRDKLEKQLIELKRIDWAREEFLSIEKLRWAKPEDNGLSFLKIKGIRSLDKDALGILKCLYEWRENEAQSLDRPTFRVIGNESLVAIARSRPNSTDDLLQIGVARGHVKRYGKQLIEATRSGIDKPFVKPRAPRRRQNHPPVADGVIDKLKAMRDTVAGELGLEPGVLCPNGTLHAIARAAPSSARDLKAIPELRPWQTAALGPDRILKNAS